MTTQAYAVAGGSASPTPLIANHTHASQPTASWLEGLSRLDGDESH